MLNKLKMGFYHIYVYLFRSNSKFINLYWFNTEVNFGDSINLFLVNKLSSKKVVWVYPKYCLSDNYLCIGSVLNEVSRNTVVWGSGFITNNITKLKRPKKIYAVRGPKSRQVFIENGIDCPEVYGDPALLLPKIYFPKIKKKYKLGIIPHYVDKNNIFLSKLKSEKGIKILDIQEKNPLKFIDDLLSCEQIVSSSLHGLIVADAYAIPSIWIKFSDNIVGGNFKFLDYFMSVGRKDKEALFVNHDISIDDLLNHFYNYEIKIDLELLLEACPFYWDRAGKDMENNNILTVDRK